MPIKGARSRERSAKAILLGAIALALPEAALGADRYWDNPAGGVFSEAGNWQNDNPPGPSDKVFFELGGSYAVDFIQDAASGGVLVDNDSVTWNLNGHTWSAIPSGWQDFVVGDTHSGALSVVGGSITVGGARARMIVGNQTGSSGRVIVSGAGTNLSIGGGFFVGNFGSGELDVLDGAALSTGSAAISNGSVSLSQNGTWKVGGDLNISYGGRLTNTAGTNLQITGALKVSDALGNATATLTSLNTNPTSVSVNGGTLTLSDSTLTGTALRLGPAGSLALQRTTISGGTLNVSGSGAMLLDNSTVTVTTISIDGGTLTVAGSTLTGTSMRVAGAIIALSDGTVNATELQLGGGVLQGSGAVNASISGVYTIWATGDLTLGSVSSFTGFNYSGTLDVGSHMVTLNSKGFANLGPLTTIDSGTLSAPNGISLGVGNSISARGRISGKLAAAFGSVIQATGDLAVGDNASYAGFFSDGEMYVGNHVVTLNDKNEAVLGSITQVGSEAGPGTLTAPNGFLLEAGKNLVGYGTINGSFRNLGFVEGKGQAPSDALTFAGPVTGSGSFAGNVILAGGYSPDAAATKATMEVTSGGVQVTGPLQLAIGQVLTKTGSGVLSINGPQTAGAGAIVDAAAGQTVFTTDAGGELSAVVREGASLTFASTEHLHGLSIAAGARASVSGSLALVLDSAVIDPSGVLDLGGGAMVLRGASDTRQAIFDNITSLLGTGRSKGAWNGVGINSSAAAAQASHLTGLAAIVNEKTDSEGNLVPIFTTFDGQGVDQNCILVKYTLNGDTNLDGIINFDDYYQINTGFLSNGTLKGYRWGDFNYDGLINFDDYFLINTAFLGQNSGTGMSMSVVVPEPGVAFVFVIVGLTVIGRTRRARACRRYGVAE